MHNNISTFTRATLDPKSTIKQLKKHIVITIYALVDARTCNYTLM